MAHNIRCLIGTESEIISVIQHLRLPRKAIVNLPQNFDLVFLDETAMEAVKKNWDNEQHIENSWGLTQGILDFMQFICREKIAYIETEYFGGTGTQCAALVEKGKLFVFFFEPDSPYTVEDSDLGSYPEKLFNCPINRVLRYSGIERETGRDEFDTLHLADYRTMDN